MLDLDAYLARIGLSGRPSIAQIHLAHVVSIPFENLDPHGGIAVSLEPEDLTRKLIVERRGGICFEHNALLKAMLEELGAEVDVFLARVRLGPAPAITRPRSHPVLRVRLDGVTWFADVGFGTGGLLKPIPFGPGVEQSQAGWRFRMVEDGIELVLQVADRSEWIDLYGFVPEPVPLVELEVSSWFTSTYPSSRFVTGLCVSRHGPDGARVILSDWDGTLSLTETTPGQAKTAAAAWEDVPEILASRFELPGFTLSRAGRIVAMRPARLHDG